GALSGAGRPDADPEPSGAGRPDADAPFTAGARHAYGSATPSGPPPRTSAPATTASATPTAPAPIPHVRPPMRRRRTSA
ncbi:serine/threonine protein kinase, partial [Streptomyces parvulus]